MLAYFRPKTSLLNKAIVYIFSVIVFVNELLKNVAEFDAELFQSVRWHAKANLRFRS